MIREEDYGKYYVKYHAKVFVFYPESNGETVELFKSEIIYLGHTNFENKIFRY